MVSLHHLRHSEDRVCRYGGRDTGSNRRGPAVYILVQDSKLSSFSWLLQWVVYGSHELLLLSLPVPSI